MIDRRSLSGRLFVIFLVTVAAYATVALGVLGQVAREHPGSQFSALLLHHLVRTLDSTEMTQVAAELGIKLVRVGPDGAVWASHGDLPPVEDLLAATPPETDFAFFLHQGDRYAVLRQDDTTFFSKDFKTPLSAYAVGLMGAGLVLVLLIAAANYLLVRRLIRPIPAVRAAADRFAAGDLGHRLPIGRRDDELADLMRAINAMAAHLEALLEAKRDLLMAIGHEVRSPLARARLLAEIIPDSPHRTGLITALGEIDRLTAALLEAEALDGGRHHALSLEDLSLREVLAEAVAGLDGGERVRLTPPPGDDPAMVRGDPLRLGLLIRNLLTNALVHGGTGPVEATLTPRPTGGWRLSVRDHGPGIAPEHLSRLGEPFYRPDPSRQRATGGHGLGLTLCHRIAVAHGGHLTLSSTPGEGTLAVMDLPPAPQNTFER